MSGFRTVVSRALFIAVLGWSSDIHAGQERYFYDGLGRLVAVVDELGNSTLYTYDAAGNMLSVTRGAVTAPVVTGMTPDSLEPGVPTLVTISGSGLSFSSLSTTHPDLQIRNPTASDIIITATLVAPIPTAFGPTSLTVTALGGAVSVPLTIREPPPPTITRLVPNGGAPGTVVVIEGTGFGTIPGSNLVTFTGLGGARLPATVFKESGTSLQVQAPTGTRGGPVTVQVGSVLSAGVLFVIPGITTISATAAQGAAVNPAMISANANQDIQVQGAGFSPGVSFVFASTNDLGQATIAVTSAFSISPDGTTARVFVPSGATTGAVTYAASSLSGVPLQIVPTVDGLVLPEGASFAPGLEATLSGTGFKEGATMLTFPGVSSPVATTDVFSTGFGGQNNRLTVTVPDGTTIPAAGMVIPLTVRTDGGTSNGFPLAHPLITEIVATAARGTPLNSAQPSANINQLVTLNGGGFRTFMSLLANGTEFLFPSFNVEDGSASQVHIEAFDVSSDGRSVNLNVPFGAISGQITVQDPVTRLGSGSVGLQIVPVIENINGFLGEGSQLDIRGNGFEPSSTRVLFPGVADPVSADNSSVISSAGTELLVTVPPGVDPAGQLTVRTNAGVSNPFDLATLGQDEIEPNDDPSTATRLAIESSKRGAFQNSEDSDYYRFTVGGLTELRVSLEGLGSLMNVRLTFLDHDGTTVLETIEAEIGAEQGRGFSITPETAGDYFLRVIETSGQQGPEFTYLIRLFTSD